MPEATPVPRPTDAGATPVAADVTPVTVCGVYVAGTVSERMAMPWA